MPIHTFALPYFFVTDRIAYRTGEGNIFTGICLSTGGLSVHVGGGGGCLPMEGGGLPLKGGGLYGAEPPPPPHLHLYTPRYCQPAVGTYPTGMHSCIHLWKSDKEHFYWN